MAGPRRINLSTYTRAGWSSANLQEDRIVANDDLNSDFPGTPPPAASKNADEPVMLFYDAAGKKVSADSPAAVRQFLSDDPNRPDASKEEKDESGAKPLSETGTGPAELLFYDAAGKRVSEPVNGGWQFAPDDALRPDSPEQKALRAAAPAAKASTTDADEDEEAVDGAEQKAQPQPAENKARKSSANK